MCCIGALNAPFFWMFYACEMLFHGLFAFAMVNYFLSIEKSVANLIAIGFILWLELYYFYLMQKNFFAINRSMFTNVSIFERSNFYSDLLPHYRKNERGEVYLPFDRGCCANIWEFWLPLLNYIFCCRDAGKFRDTTPTRRIAKSELENYDPINHTERLDESQATEEHRL